VAGKDAFLCLFYVNPARVWFDFRFIQFIHPCPRSSRRHLLSSTPPIGLLLNYAYCAAIDANAITRSISNENALAVTVRVHLPLHREEYSRKILRVKVQLGGRSLSLYFSLSFGVLPLSLLLVSFYGLTEWNEMDCRRKEKE
jgi:hypothetical protein